MNQHNANRFLANLHNAFSECAFNNSTFGNIGIRRIDILDVSAAFDTVDHGKLLTVLERRFGISGKALQWYCSYLAERTQTLQVVTILSRTYNVDCSVPQGSVLGALKFITYTEDFPTVIEKRNIDHHLYADNGQLSDHPSIATVLASIYNLEVCVYEVHNW